MAEKGGPEVAAGSGEAAALTDSPLKFVALIAQRPKLFFALFLCLNLLSVVILVTLLAFKVDVIPLEFSEIPLDLVGDVDFLRQTAWAQAPSAEGIVDRLSASVDRTDRKDALSEVAAAFSLYFVGADDGNVFTKQHLQSMKEVEEKFFTNGEYATNYCHKDARTSACALPNSILRYFDGSKRAIHPDFYDPQFNKISQVLYRASVNDASIRELQFFLPADARISASEAFASKTRMFMDMGGPLAGFNNLLDRTDEQTKKRRDFQSEHFKKESEKLFREGYKGLKVVYFSPSLMSETITQLVIKDQSLIVISIIFIVIFMLIQTQSFWVTGLAVLSILMAFCWTVLLYRFVFDFRYFGVFHILALFIILGIGADDIFVFFDTWKESAHQKFASVAHRMSFCYRRAALAMLFTSLTTAVAFLISATSPLLGINSFGAFAGILVLINYLTAITFFPTVVITYHLYWERYRCLCCCRQASTTGDQLQLANAESSPPKRNFVVRFMIGPYYKFITHRVARWFILLFFAALTAVAIYFATQIKPNDKETKFLRDSTNFGQFFSLTADFTKSEGSNAVVHVVWGLKEQDRGSCHSSNYSCTGKVVWDDQFNLNSEAAQEALLRFCQDLVADSGAVGRLKIAQVAGVPEVRCFAVAASNFFAAGSPGATYPLSAPEVRAIVDSRRDVFQEPIPQDFARMTEVGLSYWLYNGFDGALPAVEYFALLGEQNSDVAVASAALPTFRYMTRLRYVAVDVNVTLTNSLVYTEGLRVRDEWEKYVGGKVAEMPAGLRGGFQTSELWHWYKLQKHLVHSAILGISVSIAVALPLLILATMNIFLGLLATFCILLVTICVVAVIPLAGWRLGTMESLNLVLIVGLAVDYVVHLAEGYARSGAQDRAGRTHDMLREVALSVLSGACTTLGSSVVLLFANIVFFAQFGTFMFATILCSLSFSLGLFCPLVALLGPQGHTGDLRYLFRRLPCFRSAVSPVERT